MQLLQPLRVVDIRLPTRDILDMPRIDQQDLDTTRLKNLEDRNPVNAGRLHRHGGDPQFDEPIGKLVEGAKLRLARKVEEAGCHRVGGARDAAEFLAKSEGITVTAVPGPSAVLSSAVEVLDETDAALSTGGALTISDVDSAAEFVAQTDVAGENGSFSIDAAGNWTYTANSAFDELNVGDSISDTFTVSAADGTETSVTVTINGSNDAAVLSSAIEVLDETEVEEIIGPSPYPRAGSNGQPLAPVADAGKVS